MKYLLLSFLFLGATGLHAQKYALLDMQLSRPVRYTNTITTEDNLNKLFPVEKKKLPEFLKVLKEIERSLVTKKTLEKARQYEVGCVKFTGTTLDYPSGQRLDYVITSNCENLDISMHLCDARLNNARNAFFIKTWIKYIENKQ